MPQCPFPSSPSSAAKQAPLSKRGTQSQSMQPSSPTRAAVCVSPMSAYRSIGVVNWVPSLGGGELHEGEPELGDGLPERLVVGCEAVTEGVDERAQGVDGQAGLGQ